MTGSSSMRTAGNAGPTTSRAGTITKCGIGTGGRRELTKRELDEINAMRPWLRAYARRWLSTSGAPITEGDLVTDCMTAAWDHLSRLPYSDNPVAGFVVHHAFWTCRKSVLKARSGGINKKRGCRKAQSEPLAVVPASSFLSDSWHPTRDPQDFEHSLTHIVLRPFWEGMRPHEQALLTQHFWLGMSSGEIAKESGEAAGVVKSRLAGLVRKIRRWGELVENGYSPDDLLHCICKDCGVQFKRRYYDGRAAECCPDCRKKGEKFKDAIRRKKRILAETPEEREERLSRRRISNRRWYEKNRGAA